MQDLAASDAMKPHSKQMSTCAARCLWSSCQKKPIPSGKGFCDVHPCFLIELTSFITRMPPRRLPFSLVQATRLSIVVPLTSFKVVTWFTPHDWTTTAGSHTEFNQMCVLMRAFKGGGAAIMSITIKNKQIDLSPFEPSAHT